MQLKNAEVLAIPPVNAWLLMADSASEPTRQELKDESTATDPVNRWTGPPHARVGDLLFFYFRAPDKAVRYVARVASDPFFDSESEVSTLGTVGTSQWWVWHTPLVPVPEVSYKELSSMHNGHLILKGQSGKYLSPEVVRQTLEIMRSRVHASVRAEVEAVVQVPLGDPDLPTPATMTKQQWAAMADGAFKREAQVEEFVVDPLLRFVLGADASLTVQPQYPANKGRADWGVVRAGMPTAVIETKRGIGEPRGSANWMDSPAFAQLRRYMDVLNVPGLLIDTRRMMLVDPGAAAPATIIDRRSATDADFTAIGHHLGVNAGALQAVTQIEADLPTIEAIVPDVLLPTAEFKADDDGQNEGAQVPLGLEPSPSVAPTPEHQVVVPEFKSDAGGLTQFIPAHTNLVGSVDILDALPGRQAAATVREQVKDVIESEGPIEVGRLARVVARRFGLNAVNAARAKDIIKLVPKDQLVKGPLGVFAWPASLDPSAWACVRLVDASRTRSFEQIAPQEIANVMHGFYRGYPEGSDEDALRRTAEFFGITRKSAEVRSRLVAVHKSVATETPIAAPLPAGN